MGWLNANGIWIGRNRGGGISWQTYWTHQSEVLFFAETNDVVAGKLYNRVSGRTAEYLTLTGSAGSEVYTAPDTADYQTADTDRLWFLPSTTPLNVTTADLVAYDFTRTIVKYDSETPHTIRAIMILSSDIPAVNADRLHKDFLLSIYWSGVYNDSGVLKDNKPATERYLWNLPKTITGLVAWFSGKVPEAFTLAGTSVNIMEDLSENGNHLLAVAADTTRPTYSAVTGRMTLVAASSQRLRLAACAINQPHTRFMVYKKLVLTDIAGYIMGSATNVAGLNGTGTSGDGIYIMHAGTALNYGANNLLTNLHILVFNGASSSGQINDGAPVVGNTNTNNMNGIELGSYNNGAGGVFFDAEFCESIDYTGIVSDSDKLKIKSYLQTKWGL
jgi:hypothetical protein